MTTTEILRARIEGKPGVIGATCITKSGRYFDFIDPRPEMIDIDDIAWGLANTCRFGGQSLEFYSVAQHSVIVSQIVPPTLAFAGLMHDAAEAYIGDMVGPLKQLLPEFKAIEKRIEARIFEVFGLSMPMPPEIKQADLRALRTEQRDLTSGSGDNWNGLDNWPPMPQRIVALTPREAYRLFLDRYAELVGDREGYGTERPVIAGEGSRDEPSSSNHNEESQTNGS